MDKELLLNLLPVNYQVKIELRNLFNNHNINEVDEFTTDLIISLERIMSTIPNELIDRKLYEFDGEVDYKIDKVRNDLSCEIDNKINECIKHNKEFYSRYGDILKKLDHINLENLIEGLEKYKNSIHDQIKIERDRIFSTLSNEVRALNEVLENINEYLEQTRPVNLRRDVVTPSEIREKLKKSQMRIARLLRN